MALAGAVAVPEQVVPDRVKPAVQAYTGVARLVVVLVQVLPVRLQPAGQL